MTRRDVAINAVYCAGGALEHMFGEVTRGTPKEHELELVSRADLAAEEEFIYQIRKNFPDDGILSEESAETPSKNGYRWIIDPLDGTHNFLAGLKEWGPLLALEENGVVVLGICYFPKIEKEVGLYGGKMGEIFYAEKGKGTSLNGKRIFVSDAELKGQIFCSDTPMRIAGEKILRDISRFTKAGCRFRAYGSGYALTRVAIGQAVAAINRTNKIWDIAAPALLVEEAGGLVTIDSDGALMTNRVVHFKALKLFR